MKTFIATTDYFQQIAPEMDLAAWKCQVPKSFSLFYCFILEQQDEIQNKQIYEFISKYHEGCR